MSQRDDKTIAFRPRVRREASTEAVDEPVYEVDDVAVGPDGSVSPRPSGGELASPSTRARSHRRARATSDAGEPTPLRPHPARTAPSAASTGDLHRARDVARAQAADGRGDRSRRRGGAGAGQRARGAADAKAKTAKAADAKTAKAAGTPKASKGVSAAAKAGAAVAGGARSAAQRLTSAVTSARRGGDSPSRARRGRTSPQDGAEGQSVKRRLPRPSRRALAVLAVAVVAVVALYGPVRDLYMAKRNNQILQDVLTEINAENEAVEKRARDLTTEQGIEDEARLHGYVKEGEEAATVSGLPGEQGGEAVPIPDDVRAAVLAREDPWYIQALDRLFFYQKGDQNHE
ncbi:septum formation initiator family protein [Caniella muris]|uniref:septum formation initiator family protein n=1 Tax=Caniella muris TaxID=2941502 RepID=UPI00204150E6|nr:septum formation initiator family protein [Caniella muris]